MARERFEQNCSTYAVQDDGRMSIDLGQARVVKELDDLFTCLNRCSARRDLRFGPTTPEAIASLVLNVCINREG